MNANDIGPGFALITSPRFRPSRNTWTFEGSDLTNIH